MLADIVADVQVFNLPKLGELDEHVLVELVKVVLELLLGEGARGMVAWVLVQIGEHHGLGEVGLNMFP
jgi:hypothetical protein